MTKFRKIDKQKIEEALELIEKLKVHEGMFSSEVNDIFIKDGADEALEKVWEIFNDNEEYEMEIPEKSLENVENFNPETLSQLQEYFKDPIITVFGHGTLAKESAEKIIAEGLKMKIASTLASAIPLDYTQNSFHSIKNWPHLGAKYIVLIGLQDSRAFIPSLQEHERETEYSHGYVMNRNRIIGYIDVESESFVPSPYYEKTQTYDPEYNVLPDNPQNQKGYEQMSNILMWLQIFSNHGNYLEIDDQRKFDGIIENSFQAAKVRIKENIEYIKEKLKTEGITRDEYEASIHTHTPDTTSITDFDDFSLDSWDYFNDFTWDDDVVEKEPTAEQANIREWNETTQRDYNNEQDDLHTTSELVDSIDNEFHRKTTK